MVKGDLDDDSDQIVKGGQHRVKNRGLLKSREYLLLAGLAVTIPLLMLVGALPFQLAAAQRTQLEVRVGIGPTHLKIMLVPFKRLHDSEVAGAGIAIAAASSRIVERYDRRIWGKSREENGATFYLSLPAAEQAVQRG